MIDKDTLEAVPIDHGFVLPRDLTETRFEWIRMPHLKSGWEQMKSENSPDYQRAISYIDSIDVEKDAVYLRKRGFPEESIRTMQWSALFLKRGIQRELDPQTIGEHMLKRGYCRTPSFLETLVERAQRRRTPMKEAIEEGIDNIIKSQRKK